MQLHLRALAAPVVLLVALSGCAASAPQSPPSVTAPSPSETSTPAPPTLAEYLDTWDEFATFEANGTGDSSFDLPDGLTNGMVTATHDGTSYFEVHVTDDAGKDSDYPLVSTRGPYQGVVGWGIGTSDGRPDTRISIVADGAWTFRLEPLSRAPLLEVPAEGSTDAVYRYDGSYDDRVTWTVSWEGERHFALAQYYGDRDIELHVNEGGGPGVESVRLRPGPSLFAIHAEDVWRITAP